MLGGSTLACCGLSYVASQAGSRSATPQVETPDFTYGTVNGMLNKSVLVAYASRTGSTVGVASKIGETIAGHGYTVDVKPVNEDPDPEVYQAVIIGSAVNGGKWLPEAVDFVQRYQPTLKQKQVALFCVHILNWGNDEKSRKNRLAYLDPIRSSVEPVDEAFFLGKGMDPNQMAPLLLWLMRKTGFVLEGDCRDWSAILTWAESLSDQLL